MRPLQISVESLSGLTKSLNTEALRSGLRLRERERERERKRETEGVPDINFNDGSFVETQLGTEHSSRAHRSPPLKVTRKLPGEEARSDPKSEILILNFKTEFFSLFPLQRECKLAVYASRHWTIISDSTAA